MLSVPSTHAAELLPSFINTAVAKEDNTDTLTADERKAILHEIISSSQSEIENLKDKLTALTLDDNWNRAREQFLDKLATSSDYYNSLGKQLDRESITLDDIKLHAKELKERRETIYAPELKVIGNLILIFQTDDILRVVQARNEKIANDIKKLDRQKLVNTDTLKKYLAQADKSIKNARILNNKAKDAYYQEVVEPLQPKDTTEQAVDEVRPALLMKSLEISTTPAESAADKPSVKTIEEKPAVVKTMADKQDDIRDLSKDSLKELKTAYELFFKMNDRIRK